MIKKFDRLLKNIRLTIFPVATILVSNLIAILPYKSNSSSLLTPLFSLMVIYFWSIYRPRNLPYLVVFILGLFKDIIENAALGSNAFCFLLFQALVKSQRKYLINHAFIVVWAGFIFFSGLIILVSLFLNNFSADIKLYPFAIIFSQWLITILVYVPMHYLLSKLNNLNSPFNE